MKKIILMSLLFMALASINSIKAQEVLLPCEEELYKKLMPDWVENNQLSVNAPISQCPGCTITFKYNYRFYYNMLFMPCVDIIITEYDASPQCASCNINIFELMLWRIWLNHIDEWDLDENDCNYEVRYGAASCWRNTVLTNKVEARPCSSTCCVNKYKICRDLGYNFTITSQNSRNITENCTIQPCTYYVCDEIWNIDVDLADNNDYLNANPGFLNKRGINIDEFEFIENSLFPNPSSDFVTIILNQIYNNIELLIYDNNGNICYNNYFNKLDPPSIKVDLESFHIGNYLLVVKENGKILFTKKLIVIR